MSKPSISLRLPKTYQISLVLSLVLPALILNPVLFLHGLNAILSRVLSPIKVPHAVTQPPAYYALGPSAQNPHINIHSSESVCWGYTALMLVAQLVAFQVFKMPSTSNEEESEGHEQTIEPTEEKATAFTDKLKPDSPSGLSLSFSALIWAINIAYDVYRKRTNNEIGRSLGNDTSILLGVDQVEG